MLQQVTAEVQPRLAAQVNSAVSLDITCVYGECHILSPLFPLLLLIICRYDKAHLTHLPVVEEVAGPRDICQAVLTAIFPSGVLLHSSSSVFLNHFRT